MSKIDRLDFSKPPPGWAWYDDRQEYVVDIEVGRPGLLTPSSAWSHHKFQCNPPGMRTVWVPDDRCYPDHTGEWHIEVVTGGPALTAEFFVCDLHDSAGETKARAAAWAHYVDAVEVADKLDRFDPRKVTGWNTTNIWPRALTWTAEQRAEVRCWLINATAELPEVLRAL